MHPNVTLRRGDHRLLFLVPERPRRQLPPVQMPRVYHLPTAAGAAAAGATTALAHATRAANVSAARWTARKAAS